MTTDIENPDAVSVPEPKTQKKRNGFTLVELMVVIFMVVSAIFFFIADSIIRWGVQTLLSFGS